jgi:hypothetical protein
MEATAGRWLWLAVPLLAYGCPASDDDVPPADVGPMQRECPIGDVTQPAQLEFVHRDVLGQMVLTSSSARVPLFQSDQGGYLVFMSVRAKNLDGCRSSLTISVHEPCDDRSIGQETRAVSLVPGDDGWAAPEFPTFLTNFGNIPMCPSSGAVRNLHDEPYLVRATIQDLDGQIGTATTSIIPFCHGDQEERCLCECNSNFVIVGSCDALDAGVGPSSCDGG